MSLDLSSLELALASLERGLLRSAKDSLDEEVRDACIQRFEYSFELSWKMLKRRLELDLPNPSEVDTFSYRNLIRVGAERGFLQNPTEWFIYRDRRNMSSHTYNPANAKLVYESIPSFLQDAKLLLAHLKHLSE